MTTPRTSRRALLTAAGIAVPASLILAPTATAHATPAREHRRRSPQQVVAAFYHAFNTGDLDAFDAPLSPDWIDEPLGAPGQQPGPADFKPIVAYLRTAFPDLTVTNQDVIADRDKVAVRSSVTGTHLGEFIGYAPTGRRITYRAFDIHQVRNGQIIHTWHLEDNDAVKQQLAT